MLNSSGGSQCMTNKEKLQDGYILYRSLLEKLIPLSVSLHLFSSWPERQKSSFLSHWALGWVCHFCLCRHHVSQILSYSVVHILVAGSGENLSELYWAAGKCSNPVSCIPQRLLAGKMPFSLLCIPCSLLHVKEHELSAWVSTSLATGKRDSTLDCRYWNWLPQAAARTFGSEVFPMEFSGRWNSLFGAGHFGCWLQPLPRRRWEMFIIGSTSLDVFGRRPGAIWISAWSAEKERDGCSREKEKCIHLLLQDGRLRVFQKPWWRPVPFLSFGPWTRAPSIFFLAESSWCSYINPTDLVEWPWSLV